ncbi:immunity-related GTPase family M protein-like [Meles meles]|uniref:immunity-related GTPase family M protein-like n=1 Tax=Meles meles TaxID=9662 RepID=UPI001E69B2DA|nr:immunity-related GTPase family M protein-like [Meles meles]XP_045855941.1 immunity-related GTPase family M protein-like [Meles meles]
MQPSPSLHTPSPTSFTSAGPHDEDWSILSISDFGNTEKASKEWKLPEIVSVIKETMKTASSTLVRIAVTGDSGNGMSSFINALRGIGQEEEDSAPTGVVRTTQIPTLYFFSHMPNVELWDLPGTGAATQSLETYLEEIQFSKYDLFIIIASEQFSMNLVKLAKIIQGRGKKFYVVWTKLDRDLSTRVVSKEKLLQDIQENIRVALQNEGVYEPIIFLVSNFDPFLHDFPELKKSLCREVSDIRYHKPQQKLSDTYGKIINDKAITFWEQTGSESFQDSFGIQNANDLEEFLNACHSFFGLDDESLQEVAQSMGKPMEEYKAIMKSQDLHTVLSRDWVLSWTNCNRDTCLYSVLNRIPFVGNTGFHYLRVWNQWRLLNNVTQDTETILKKVLTDAAI